MTMSERKEKLKEPSRNLKDRKTNGNKNLYSVKSGNSQYKRVKNFQQEKKDKGD